MIKKITTFKPKVPMNIKNLSWKQAKARFPLLKPYGNADGDRLTNCRDCKPFDRLRQGERHETKEEKIERFDNGLISEEEIDNYEYFLGPDPRKHKDFEFYGGKKK